MRPLSGQATSSINASTTGEVWLPLVVLSHPSWDDPVRLVRNTQAIQHQGQTFQPFPFDISLPDEEAEQTAVVEWVADNVSRDLIALFRRVSGSIAVSAFWVLASNPDFIEVGPFDLELRAFEYDDMHIKGSLSVQPVLDAAFSSMSMDTKHAPGLF